MSEEKAKKENNLNEEKNQEAQLLTEPVVENSKEVLELKDRMLRLAAEFDNYKKRTAKEIDSAKSMGKIELTVKLLSVMDEFELAIESMKLNDDSEKGIAMVFSNFVETLKKEGLREIEAKGQFDPYKHEIILAKDDMAPYGTILQIVRKGYILNGIMIRPASIIISNGEKAKKEKESKEENKK